MKGMRGARMKKLLIFMLIAFTASLVITGNHTLASDEVFHGGDVLYTKPVKAVLFSHESHVESLGLSCDMCHNAIFEMASLTAQENDDFTMQSLYDGKYCGACHSDGSMAFASDTQCARCHVGVKGYKARNKDAAESNDNHH
jgi:c(7)-type cytochrome triheme protein